MSSTNPASVRKVKSDAPATRRFIIDCPTCKAKVAATELGRAEITEWDDEIDGPIGERLYLGQCPSCKSLLAGKSHQVDFAGFDADEDAWSDIIRVYPKPPKTFLSSRIPRVVKDSLNEAHHSLQGGANIAACVMLGRALEAVCRHVLNSEEKTAGAGLRRKQIMLGEGIERLREHEIIDQRLFDWSQQLQAFRNLAAHPEDISISREDAEDFTDLCPRYLRVYL
jgi:hypothetical protein